MSSYGVTGTTSESACQATGPSSRRVPSKVVVPAVSRIRYTVDKPAGWPIGFSEAAVKYIVFQPDHSTTKVVR